MSPVASTCERGSCFVGTRGAVDFTEFPSHLFEHFVTDHQSLSRVISVQLGDRKLMEQYHQGVHLFGHIEAVQLVLKTAVDMVRKGSHFTVEHNNLIFFHATFYYLAFSQCCILWCA